MKYHLLVAIALLLTLTGCINPFTIFVPSPKKSKIYVKYQKAHVVKYKKPRVVKYQKPTAAKLTVFQKTMREVALSTQNDPRYNKMTLDTPLKKSWFKDLMYKLWDRQITKSQFVTEGLRRYPSHRYEFTFVADGFQKRS